MEKFNVIYADPGWKFNNKKTGGSMKSGSASQYSVMDVRDIAALPVQDICAKDSCLFMWWVDTMPLEALHVLKNWDFTFKKMNAFVWEKQTKTGKDCFGMGHYTRPQVECVMLGVKGKFTRDDASVRQLIRTVEDESVVKAYNAGHSIKPPEVRDRIVKLCGNVPRIELFARTKPDGWSVWGDQVESDIVFL